MKKETKIFIVILLTIIIIICTAGIIGLINGYTVEIVGVDKIYKVDYFLELDVK